MERKTLSIINNKYTGMIEVSEYLVNRDGEIQYRTSCYPNVVSALDDQISPKELINTFPTLECKINQYMEEHV